MERITSGETISSNSLIELRDYWLEKRKGRAYPARSDIDPVEFPNLLPRIVLVDVTHNPLRFKYRLIGTTITAISERDATGRFIDQELYGDRTENMLWTFRKCVSTNAPIAVREQVQFVKKERVIVEVIALPMGKTDTQIDMILTCVEVIHSLEKAPAMGTSLILDWNS